jgi:DNA modification methylase
MKLDLYCGDAKDILKKIPDESIDVFLVSPPYGKIRKYHGFSFNADLIFPQMVRTLSKGGVILWNESDQQKGFNLSGETFKHFLKFKELGLLLNQVIIVSKNACPYPGTYFGQTHEYLGVFSKNGKFKVFQPLMKPNKQAGKVGKAVSRKGENELLVKTGKTYTIKPFGKLGSVWGPYEIGGGKQYEPGLKLKHPGIMNLKLAVDCLKVWADKDSTVADICLGSGSTLVAAKMLGCKRGIGIDVSQDYINQARERINRTQLLPTLATVPSTPNQPAARPRLPSPEEARQVAALIRPYQ